MLLKLWQIALHPTLAVTPGFSGMHGDVQDMVAMLGICQAICGMLRSAAVELVTKTAEPNKENGGNTASLKAAIATITTKMTAIYGRRAPVRNFQARLSESDKEASGLEDFHRSMLDCRPERIPFPDAVLTNRWLSTDCDSKRRGDLGFYGSRMVRWEGRAGPNGGTSTHWGWR